jgi:hypothetical protein
MRVPLSSALRPGRDAHNPIARRVLGVLGVRTRPVWRLSAVAASVPQPPVPS